MKGPLKAGRKLLWLVAGLLAAGMMTAVSVPPAASSAATMAQLQSVPTGLGGRVWNVIPVHAKVVALTFDAGANADGVASSRRH